MQNPDRKALAKIPAECIDVILGMYEVRICAPHIYGKEVFDAKITVLKGLPHFLFWYRLDPKGNSIGERQSYSVASIYENICNKDVSCFQYGARASKRLGANLFFTEFVIYFSTDIAGDSDELYIEFDNEYEYIQWKRAVMFLMKTASGNYGGVRDSRRAKVLDNTSVIIRPAEEEIGNVMRIEESDKKIEMWKDIKVTFKRT
jgi:hypothetical protein